MFASFKKYFSTRKPAFNSLNGFEHKDKYFYRVASWYWHNHTQITIIDPHGPRVITLDTWPQIVFLEARGRLTVTEFVDDMASKYSGKIPEELDVTIIDELSKLLKENLIAYSDTKIILDPSIEYSKNKNSD